MKEYKNTYYQPAQKYCTDLALYAAGHAQCAPDQHYGPIIRQYHVLHFVLRGGGVLEIKNRSIPVSAGQGFLIPAGTIARYQADETDPWEYCWVNFYGLQADHYVEVIQSASSTGYVFPVSDPLFYMDQIQQLLDLRDSTLPSVFEGLSRLYAILGRLGRDLEIHASSRKGRKVIEDVKFYIDLNISDNFRICELAEIFSIHQNYLIRKFTDTYGISPKQYILDVKLQRAKELLQDTEDSVQLISQSLGFADQAAFSRSFKKKFGFSPSAVRQ